MKKPFIEIHRPDDCDEYICIVFVTPDTDADFRGPDKRLALGLEEFRSMVAMAKAAGLLTGIV